MTIWEPWHPGGYNANDGKPVMVNFFHGEKIYTQDEVRKMMDLRPLLEPTPIYDALAYEFGFEL